MATETIQVIDRLLVLPDPDHDDVQSSDRHGIPYNTTYSTVDAKTSNNNFLHGNLPLNYPYAIFEMLVALFACVGNALVIIVFHRERRLRKRTNYYIVSLAMADFLVGSLGIPFAVLASIGLPANLYGCLFTLSILVVLCTISIFCLVAVSIDRYWAILYPLAYSRNVSTKTAIYIISFCWFLGLVVGFLPIIGWRAPSPPEERDGCFFVEVMDYDYLVFLYFATIITPAFLLLAFYAHIYTVILKQIRKTVTVKKGNLISLTRTHGGMLRVLGAARKREVKATQNLSIIVLFFMVCWFPLYTVNCIKAFYPSYDINAKLMLFLILLSHLNSAVNPLLYAYHLKDFRGALKSLICKLFGIKCQRPEANSKFSVRSQHRLPSIYEKRHSSQPKIYIDSPVYLRQRASNQSMSSADIMSPSALQHNSHHHNHIRIVHDDPKRQTTRGDLHMWRILEVSAEDRSSTGMPPIAVNPYQVTCGHHNYTFDYDQLDRSVEHIASDSSYKGDDSPSDRLGVSMIPTVSAKVQYQCRSHSQSVDDPIDPVDLSIYDRCRHPELDPDRIRRHGETVFRPRSRSLSPPQSKNTPAGPPTVHNIHRNSLS